MEEGSGKDLASRIGETVEIKGVLSNHDDWSILSIADQGAVTPIAIQSLDFSNQLSLCQ